MQQERKQQAVGFGGVERALERPRRRSGIAKGIARDRL